MTSVLYALDDVGCLRAFNNILTMLSEKLGNVGFVINHFHAGRKTYAKLGIGLFHPH